MLAGLVEDTVIKALHVAYDAAMEKVEIPFFNLVSEVIIDINQQGKKDSLLMTNIEALT